MNDILKEKGFKVNLKIDHESLDFVGYDIEPNEPVYALGSEHHLLRLEIDKKTKEKKIYSTFYFEYEVAEDLTEYLDVDWIYEEVKKIEKQQEIENHWDFYLQYLEEMQEENEMDWF